MNDDRLSQILQAAEQPLAPAPDYAAALLDDLKEELGFDVPRRPQASRVRARPRVARRPTVRRQLLLVAALLVTASLGLLPAIGALNNRVPAPPPNALAEIRQAGRIRIAIRPDHPQFQMPGQPAAGFDADVAEAIASRLGLSPAVVIVDLPAMLPGPSGNWDVGLPSAPSWLVDRAAFELSRPYYYWPRRLVVPERSAARRIADVAGRRICAVAGDAGESWLTGNYGGAAASRITSSTVSKRTDAECLAAIASGEAAAAVTARLSDAEIAVRAGIRVIGGPDPEPRVVIVPRSGAANGSQPSDLLRAIDAALAALRDDGTLTRLSQNRFGGDDLTAP